MFDWSWIDDLDGNGAADALADARQELLAAEAKQLALAAHWADLHAGGSVDDTRRLLPGEQRLVPIRGGRSGCADGCPEVEEYAAAELAVLLGRSTVAGEQLIADAVALRHRHPELWSAIRAGRAPAWLSAQVARRCIRAGLDAAQAEWVDSETTRYLTTLPPKRFLDLVEAKIIAADPQAAEERARAKALARFVHTGQTDEVGLRTLVARAGAGDITYVVAVLDRLAAILAERGDEQPLEVLRADALRLLANPARALALLTGAVLDEADPAVETPWDLARQAQFPHGDTGRLRDSSGAALPGACSELEQLPLLDDEELTELLEQPELGPLAVSCLPTLGADSAIPSTPATQTTPATPTTPTTGDDPDRGLLTALIEALDRFDARSLDPVTVLHVHVSDAAVRARHGVTRVEGIGPTVLGEVRDWLSHPVHPDLLMHRVQLRPVLDAATVVPVDRHEWPAPMTELATCRTPYEVFSFGTLPSRAADDDHPVPYVSDGPPGQTCLENNAKLSRFHHRLKTNGHWVLRHPEPGTYWWRTPHGHWFLVDPAGTHWHGRDENLDREWLHERQLAA